MKNWYKTVFTICRVQESKSKLGQGDTCPIEVHKEEISHHHYLDTYHEEDNIIIVHQVLKCANEGCQISVVSDDTDIFILLLHHYQIAGLKV